MDIKYIHDQFLKTSSISIDTRNIQPNSFFVAIRGERFDANTFAAEALEKGASAVIIDNEAFYIDERTILVNDSLEALQALSAYHRNHLGIPIVALTGSNGKTTTKELIQAVLSKKFVTKATFGNLNNHIGVPLTLLSFSSATEIGIVEMGANHQKEIEFLCALAQPDYGYITNFGKAHLEGFGGVEGVIKGKSEMYEYLSSHGKKAFVNLNDPIQVAKTKQMDAYTFGTATHDAQLVIDAVTADPFVTVSYSGHTIASQLIGLYNANNINAAIAVGTFFGVDDALIKAAIEGYVPENNRSQLLRQNTNAIILDAYNANPSSMAVALQNLVQLSKPNKVAILGDMFELGPESPQEHRQIVEDMAVHSNIEVLFVGKDFYSQKKDLPHFHFFADYEALRAYLSGRKYSNSEILIKGSRGMALERILDIV